MLHPLQIWFGSWAVAVSLYSLKLIPYVDLSDRAVLVLLVSTVGFGAGALAGEAATRRLISGWAVRSWRNRTQMVSIASWLAMALTGLTLMLFFVQASRNFGVTGVLGFSSELRKAVVDQRVVAHYVPFAMAASALAALAAALSPMARTRRRWMLAATVCVASLYFTTGRQLIVSAGIIAIAVYALESPGWLTGRRLVRVLAVGAALTLAIFTVLGQLKDPRYGKDDSPTFQNAFPSTGSYGGWPCRTSTRRLLSPR